MEDYTLQDLSNEEADEVTKDLQEVLKRHNCEMGVTSTINILKRMEKGIPTPFLDPGSDTHETNSTTEKGS